MGDVDGVLDVPGVAVPGDVVSGVPAPFDGGIVVAPGPVPGAHGAIRSAFGAPFDPSVPAVPVVPGAAVADPVAPIALGVLDAPAAPAFGVAAPVGGEGGTLPVAPDVGPASGTHGTVPGAIVGVVPGVVGVRGVTVGAGADVAGVVPCDAGCGVGFCAASCGVQSPSVSAAAEAMSVDVLSMAPP